ncbi:hypothetical protein VIGAN_06005500 [Vigna angularis var. angularis]|uniref:Uncharacterized protein n=1 Tax=Vigna angularis var. angularis TaxID=157739 RepID=A0A0S3S8L1_PHAAN|nr:hypothetical protein VIGAN_06005500 [Vigna angularis var. angularis]
MLYSRSHIKNTTHVTKITPTIINQTSMSTPTKQTNKSVPIRPHSNLSHLAKHPKGSPNMSTHSQPRNNSIEHHTILPPHTLKNLQCPGHTSTFGIKVNQCSTQHRITQKLIAIHQTPSPIPQLQRPQPRTCRKKPHHGITIRPHILPLHLKKHLKCFLRHPIGNIPLNQGTPTHNILLHHPVKHYPRFLHAPALRVHINQRGCHKHIPTQPILPHILINPPSTSQVPRPRTRIQNPNQRKTIRSHTHFQQPSK